MRPNWRRFLSKPRSREEIVRRAAALGALLGVICHLLPARYQAVCTAVANATKVIGGCS